MHLRKTREEWTLSRAFHEQVLSGVYEKAADARAKRLDSLKAILAEKDENATVPAFFGR